MSEIHKIFTCFSPFQNKVSKVKVKGVKNDDEEDKDLSLKHVENEEEWVRMRACGLLYKRDEKKEIIIIPSMLTL